MSREDDRGFLFTFPPIITVRGTKSLLGSAFNPIECKKDVSCFPSSQYFSYNMKDK